MKSLKQDEAENIRDSMVYEDEAELKLDTACCGKPMFEDKNYINGTHITNLVCLECGNYLHIEETQADEEIVDRYRELAQQEKVRDMNEQGGKN